MKEGGFLAEKELENYKDYVRNEKNLMESLLSDVTTGKNIRWGTHSYSKSGYQFEEDK